MQNRTVGSQSVSFAVGALDLDLGDSLLEIGRGHLAGDGALPDQLVERSLVSIEVLANLLRLAARIGRADRFVRFLGVLGFGSCIRGRTACSACRYSAEMTSRIWLTASGTIGRRRFACR